MYGARKNGQKKVDLPALSKKQVINQIGMKRFALCPLSLRIKNNSSGELLTLRSIETTFTDKRLTKELRHSDLNRSVMGCFCLCWGYECLINFFIWFFKNFWMETTILVSKKGFILRFSLEIFWKKLYEL